ncbi:MAG: SprB repeat-containing protein [Bacteroidia bacterium]|nr:SprB repeat-containing protein [Bacteroidia bacterium]
MEIINRKLLKWVFVFLVAGTVLLQLNDAFSQQQVKRGYPPDAANRVPVPVPYVTMLSEPGSKGLSKERLISVIPESFRQHPEFGKLKLEGSVESVELIHKRTENSRTFLNPDGSYTTTQASGRMHYKDVNGNWMSIDMTPSANNRTAGEFGIVNSDKPITVNLRTGNTLMVLDGGNGVSLSETALHTANAKGEFISSIEQSSNKEGQSFSNEAKFSNYWNGIDLVHVIDVDRLKTNYVLNSLPGGIESDGFLVFTETITVPTGWQVRKMQPGKEENGMWFGELEVLNASNSKVGIFEKLVYFDASENSEIEGGYKISKDGNNIRISAFVPAHWLTNSARVFPVVIDPTLTGTYSSGVIGSSYNAYCTVNMNVTIPANSTVSNALLESTYAASGSTKKRNARIKYTGPGGTTADFYCNENANGNCVLSTNSTVIANGLSATGVIPFSINVLRNTNSGASCNATNLSVLNNTWKVTLTYTTCSTPTSGGTVSGPATAECGQPLSYSISGGSGAYQWQTSADGGTTYTDVSGATGTSVSLSFNTSGNFKIRVLRTSAGCVSSYSNIFTTTVSAPTAGASMSSPFLITGLPYSGLHSTYCLPTTWAGTGNQSTAAKFFKFTTSSCGNKISINTCDVTSIFDTYIFLLNSSGTVIASNDDYVGCTYLVAGSDWLSRLQDITVTPNTEYYIVVQAYRFASPASGTFGLNVSEGSGGSVVPSVSITGGSAICNGGTLTLNAVPVNGGTSPTYSWTVNSAPTGQTSATFSSSSVNNGDVIAVTMTSNHACASVPSVSSSPYTAVVGNGPAITSSSNSPLCDGADLMLSVNVNDPVSSYSWSGPSGFSSTLQNPVVSGSTSSNSGSYSVTVTGINGCTSSSSTSAVISPALSATIASVQNPSCEGNTNGSIEVTPSGGTQPYTYFWSDGQSNATASNLAIGPYSVTIFDASGCTTNLEQELTAPTSVSAAEAGSDQSLCNVFSIELAAVAPVHGTGTWTVISGNAIINDLNNPESSVSNLDSTVENIFRWTVSNGCGSGSDDVSVKLYTAPPRNKPSVTGPPRGCMGDTVDFVTNLNAPNMVWEIRPDGIILSGQGTQNARIILGATSATGYDACVTGSNACGSNVVKCQGIRANTSVPRLSDSFSDVCEGTDYTYRIFSVAGATNYRWTATNGITFNGNPSPYYTTDTSVVVSVPVGFTSTKIGVASTSGCDFTANREVSVSATPLIPFGIIGARGNLCNSEQIYTIRTRPRQTYQWTVPTGAAILWTSAGMDSIRVQFGSNVNGSIAVRATNICGIQGPERKITVTSLPSTPGVVTGLPEACPNTHGYAYSIASVTGSSAYRWNLPQGSSITSGDGTENIEVAFGNTVSRISVQSVGTCGVSANRYFNIASNCRTGNSSNTSVNTTEVVVTKEFNLQAFPDADTKILTVTFNAPEDGVYRYKLIDQANREAGSGEFNSLKGSNMEQIDMSTLENAVYRLVIENNGKSQQLNVRFF